MSERKSASTDIRQQIKEAVVHLEHVLPGQAPIKDFVHHNTLHGFQQLAFNEAIARARRITGNRGYYPAERFRELLKEGRITREDLTAILDRDPDLNADEPLAQTANRPLKRRDIFLGALANDLSPITGRQLTWHMEELNALASFQPGVEEESRERLLSSARAAGLDGEAGAVTDLWSACLSVLGLEHFILHPEELVDLSPEQAERLLSGIKRDADRPEGYTVFSSVWPLFRLAQHLGLAGPDIRALGTQGADALFDCLSRLTEDKAGFLWLQAYERHYREQILTALARNHGRGRWAQRDESPVAQVMFCMDDREEGIRRHLEELAPDIETLGAAAHFSVTHNWRGVDDKQWVTLAPVIPEPVIPTQKVCEVPRPEDEARGALHARRHARLRGWYEGLLQESRRGLFAPAATLVAGAPLALASLVGKVLMPARFDRAASALLDRAQGVVSTKINFTAANDSPPATPENPRLGFTDEEGANRIQTLLRGSGLTCGFSPLVVILGHGSRNQNNPHASA